MASARTGVGDPHGDGGIPGPPRAESADAHHGLQRAIKQAARAGLGVSLQSRAAAALELKHRLLDTISPREPLPKRQWFVLWPNVGPLREPLPQVPGVRHECSGEAARQAVLCGRDGPGYLTTRLAAAASEPAGRKDGFRVHAFGAGAAAAPPGATACDCSRASTGWTPLSARIPVPPTAIVARAVTT